MIFKYLITSHSTLSKFQIYHSIEKTTIILLIFTIYPTNNLLLNSAKFLKYKNIISSNLKTTSIAGDDYLFNMKNLIKCVYNFFII